MSAAGSGGVQCVAFQDCKQAERDEGIDVMAQQMAGEPCKTAVARALADALDQRAPFRGRRCADGDTILLGQQPAGRFGDVVRTIDAPAIAATARMDARRAQYVTAVTPHIDVRTDLAGGITHRFLRPFEVDVAAASGDDFDGCGQRAMLRLEPAQCGFGVETVHVDDEDAGRRSGSDGDIVVRLLPPPGPDDVRVRGGVLEAIGRCRPLVARPARKDVKSPRRESQS